jgi:hypothetical protein
MEKWPYDWWHRLGKKITAFVAEGCCLAMKTLTPSLGGVQKK